MKSLIKLLLVCLLVLAPIMSYAARTNDVWVERASTYIESVWNEGRNVLINGSNKYLNFGTFSGSSGYGFRDNAGTMEFKDSGGSWSAVSSGGSLTNDSVIPDYVLSTGQTDEYCLTYEATGDTWEWQTCGAGGGISNVVEDTTPQLGGDLDGNGNSILLDYPEALILHTGAATKQSIGGGGPESLSFQSDDANDLFIWSGLSTDTEGRWLVEANGLMGWGAGTTNDQDINFFRNGAGSLAIQSFVSDSTETFRVNNVAGTSILTVNTDSEYVSLPWLLVNGAGGGAKVDVVGGGTTAIRAQNTNATDAAFSTFVTGDAQLRFLFRGDGLLSWGDGTSVADTVLYRSAANTLTTDDAFVATGGFTGDLTGNADTATAMAGSNSITPNNVLSTGQTDEYCLTYEATGTTWEWQTCASGLSALIDDPSPEISTHLDVGVYGLTNGSWTLSNTELGYLDGVTSAVQTQLNAKEPTITADSLTHADIADSDQASTMCIYIEDPTADDDLASIWANKTANDFQLTELWCESDQTFAFDLGVDDGTVADVNGTDVTCATGEAEDTSLSGDTVVAAGEELDLLVTSVSGTPTWVSVCWTGYWAD